MSVTTLEREEVKTGVIATKRELHGVNLVCWCAPLACHADVLLEIVNRK
jgi:uncharacterized protein DUF4326